MTINYLPTQDFSDDETVPEVPQGQYATSSTAGTSAQNVADDAEDFDHGENYPNEEDNDDFYHGTSDENDSYEIFDNLSLLDCLCFFAITGFPTIYWLVPINFWWIPIFFWCVPTIFWSFPGIFWSNCIDIQSENTNKL